MSYIHVISQRFFSKINYLFNFLLKIRPYIFHIYLNSISKQLIFFINSPLKWLLFVGFELKKSIVILVEWRKNMSHWKNLVPGISEWQGWLEIRGLKSCLQSNTLKEDQRYIILFLKPFWWNILLKWLV